MSGDGSHGCGDIRAAMVAHAHYLHRQGTYVGQFALVLFCISRGVRLHLWEGGTRTDLVSLYAPWAAEHCPEEKTLCADVIVVHLSDGELHYICDTVPLGRVNHFVVGEPLVPVSGALQAATVVAKPRRGATLSTSASGCGRARQLPMAIAFLTPCAFFRGLNAPLRAAALSGQS